MSRHPGPGPNQGLPSAQGWEIPSEREARSPLRASKQTHQHLNQKHSRGGRGWPCQASSWPQLPLPQVAALPRGPPTATLVQPPGQLFLAKGKEK